MNKSTLETACKNYNPDKDSNGNYGHYLAEQFYQQRKNEELEKQAEFENYFGFVNSVNKLRINIENKFVQRQIKQDFLKKYFNYKKLNGFNSLAECPDNAIGDAFKNKYNSTLKKIKEFGGGGNEK